MTSIKSQLSLEGSKHSKFYFRLGSQIFINILPELLISIAWSLIVTLIHQFVHKVEIDTILISIILGVISFLLVFRTNTAYDKYLEACKLWAEIQNSSIGLGHLCLIIWNESEDNRVKVYIFALLKNYCISVKSYLRDFEANSWNTTDLMGSLLTIDPGTDSGEFKCKHDFPPQDRNQRLGVQNVFGTGRSHLDESLRSYIKLDGTTKKLDKPLKPLEIIYQLNRAFMKEVAVKNVSNPVHGQLITWVNNLTSASFQLHRIKSMPIPRAYTAHLYQSLIIFHILLPFQTLKAVHPLPYLTLLISGITSFVLFGTLAIGERIEDPLGTDIVDLPLDDFCELIISQLSNLVEFDMNFRSEN